MKQMRGALLIDLEIKRCKAKHRNGVIVHNGDEGSRGVMVKFENGKMRAEKE